MKHEPENYRKELRIKIRNRVTELRQRGVLTSKGEKMSMSAIARTLNPAVTRTAIYLVVDGISESLRIKEALNKELQHPFFMTEKRVNG